jgi:hypothetical protein
MNKITFDHEMASITPINRMSSGANWQVSAQNPSEYKDENSRTAR